MICLSDAVQWKDIPGYEGIYQASNTGLVRTAPGKTTYTEWHGVRTWKSRILKPKHPAAKKRQDERVTLWKDGKHSDHLVSRLVASAWVEGYAPGMTVNHIDGNWQNNHCTNLEWITRGDNVRKGFDDGLYHSVQKAVTLVNGDERLSFPSVAQAERHIGRCRGYIHGCLKYGRHVHDAQGNVYDVVKGVS